MADNVTDGLLYAMSHFTFVAFSILSLSFNIFIETEFHHVAQAGL